MTGLERAMVVRAEADAQMRALRASRRAEKADRVRKLMALNPEMSKADIARSAGVGTDFVLKVVRGLV